MTTSLTIERRFISAATTEVGADPWGSQTRPRAWGQSWNGAA
jgi:hypothetical protein